MHTEQTPVTLSTPVVVLDIETTGLSPYRHAITEIAAMKLVDGQVVEQFHSLINPKQEIPLFITRLTGITNDMVKDAPAIEEVLPSLHEFLSGAIFVGHNVGFDHKFLDHYSRMYLNKPVTNELLCTCKLARRLHPEQPSKRLTALCEAFSLVNEQAHRAMSDVHATVQLLQHMQQINERTLSVHDLITIQGLGRRQIPEFLAKRR